MSKPYQYSWDESQSPLDRRPPNTLTPTSAGGQPVTYATNVNRQKTKRWVEAKTFSYDGDDWGDVDDYDEYGQGYEQTPPPPKQPTGLRQAGQGAGSSSSAEGTRAQATPQLVQDQGRKPYGNLQGQPPVASYAQPDRSATNPAPPTINTGFGKGRSNSFDEGDEARAFSAGGAPPPTGYRQPSRQTPPINTEPDKNNTPAARVSQMGVGSPSAVVASPGIVTPASGGPSSYQDQRDFSPTAMPEPLQARASPAPTGVPDTSHAGRFPPRKSSMDQHSSPHVPLSPQAAVEPAAVDASQSKPKSRSSSVSNRVDVRVASRERAGGAADKPLPFIRPADIYRRMEEERDKERKSLDSARPSLDSPSNLKADDNELTPPSQTGGLREKLSSESLGRGARARQSFEDGQDSGWRGRPSLEPVRERKSEYGFENLLANAQGTGGDTHTPKEVDRTDSDTAPPPSQGVSGTQGAPPSEGEYSAEPTRSRFDPSPKLPDLNRISGFGDNFFLSPTEDTQIAAVPAVPKPNQEAKKLEVATGLPEETSKGQLQHTPSVGFRSVVHQAFDRSIPPTPVSSVGGSNDESGVKRSDSASTSEISPIMSRVPSTSAAAVKAKEAEAREAATPAIAEEEASESRRNSKASMAQGNETQSIARKPSPAPRQGSGDSLPQSFKPGHRRDLSYPGNSRSPKRSPVVELNRQLPAGEDVEVTTEPVGLGLEQLIPPYPERALDNADIGAETKASKSGDRSPVDSVRDKEIPIVPAPVAAGSDSASPSRSGTKLALPPLPPKDGGSRSGSPIPRSESPTKGRVRDLAGKFENGQQKTIERRDSSTSSTGRRQLEEEAPPEIFRPVLPGGWVSYPTTGGPRTPDVRENEVTAEPEDIYKSTPTADSPSSASPDTPRAVHQGGDDNFDITPTTKKQQLSEIKAKDPLSKGPIAAVAVASAAAAGALATAVGLQKQKRPSIPDEPASAVSSKGSKEFEFVPSNRSVSRLEPPVPAKDDRSHMYNSPADIGPAKPLPLQKAGSSTSESSMPPPPPPKDTPPADDLAPPVPLKHKSVDSVASRDFSSLPVSVSRPPMLPSLSTDTGPYDEESDRLRKQIVKTLSQRHSAEQDPEVPAGLRPATDRHLSTDSKVLGQRPESSYLPSEYDSYFNNVEEDEHEIPHIPIPQPENPEENELPEVERQLAPVPSPTPPVEQVAQTPQTSPPIPEQTARSVPTARPATKKRFSWEDDDEEGEEEMTPVAPNAPQYGNFYPRSGAALAHQAEQNPWQDRPVSSITTPDPELRQLVGARNAYLSEAGSQPAREPQSSDADPLPSVPSGTSPTSPTSDDASRPMAGLLPAHHDVESPIKSASPDATLRVKGDESADKHPVAEGLEVTDNNDANHRTAAVAAGGVAATAGVAVGVIAHRSEGDSTMTPAETGLEVQPPHLKQFATVSEQQITPTPNIEEHPFHHPTQTSSEAPPKPDMSPPEGTQESPQEPKTSMPPPPPTFTQPKAPAFREILALKTPTERINTFNETREQYANMNMGLAHWIAHTSSQDPENADLVSKGGLARISTSGFGHKSTPSKTAFFHKHSPSVERPTLQEPYYKQYMQFQSNPATPSTPAAATPQTAQGTPSGVQGFGSPAGSGAHSKLTTQQVQAKGKDLLHTAGVLGGKAGGAASKLFAKGRNKLKGDKASTSTPSPRAQSPTPGSTSKGMTFQPDRDPSPTPIGPGSRAMSFQQPPPADSSRAMSFQQPPSQTGGKQQRPASMQLFSSSTTSFVPPGTPPKPPASATLPREGYGNGNGNPGYGNGSPVFGNGNSNPTPYVGPLGGGFVPKPWVQAGPRTPAPPQPPLPEREMEEEPLPAHGGDGRSGGGGNLPEELRLRYTPSPGRVLGGSASSLRQEDQERMGYTHSPAPGSTRGTNSPAPPMRGNPEQDEQEDQAQGVLHVVNPEESTPTSPAKEKERDGSPVSGLVGMQEQDMVPAPVPAAAPAVYYPPPQHRGPPPPQQQQHREFTPLSHRSVPRTTSRDVGPAPAPAPTAAAAAALAMYQQPYPPPQQQVAPPARASSRDVSPAPPVPPHVQVVYERPLHYHEQQREVLAPAPVRTSSRDVSPMPPPAAAYEHPQETLLEHMSARMSSRDASPAPPVPVADERPRGGALAPAPVGSGLRDVSPAPPSSHYEGRRGGLVPPRAAGMSRDVSPLRADEASVYSQQPQQPIAGDYDQAREAETEEQEQESKEVGEGPTTVEFQPLPLVRRSSSFRMDAILGSRLAEVEEKPSDIADDWHLVAEEEIVPPEAATAANAGVTHPQRGEEPRDDDASSIQPEPEHLEYSPVRRETDTPEQGMTPREEEPQSVAAPQLQCLDSGEISPPSGGPAPHDALAGQASPPYGGLVPHGDLAAGEDISRQATPESFFAPKPHAEQHQQPAAEPVVSMTSLRRQSSPSTGRRGPPRSLTLQRAIERQHAEEVSPPVEAPPPAQVFPERAAPSRAPAMDLPLESPGHHELYDPPNPPAQRPIGQQLYDTPGSGTPPQWRSAPGPSQFGPSAGRSQEPVYRPPVLVTRPGQPPQFAPAEQPRGGSPHGYPPNHGRPLQYQQSTGPGVPPQDYRPSNVNRGPVPGAMGPPGPQQQQQARPMVHSSPAQNLPDQYYPRQLPPSESLFARQQGTEYQLKGVGPPPSPEPPTQPKAKRSSGFFKGLGSITGKSDKSSPHSRTLSKSQQPPAQNLTPLAEYERRNSMISAASSTDQQEKQKRRSSFFGNLTKTSSGEGLQKQQQLEQQQRVQQQYQQPQQQYQQQAPPSKDRSSWLNIGSAVKNGQDRPSPSTPTGAAQSPIAGRRSSLLPFSSKESPGKESKPNKLTRSGTAGGTLENLSGKKKGLGGLTNIFGRSGTTGHSPKTPSSGNSVVGQQQSSPRSGFAPSSLQQQYMSPTGQSRNGARPDFTGQPPPPGGYYAPQNVMRDSPPPRAQTFSQPPPAPRPSDPGFVGGRRLSEQQIGQAKHKFESGSGFRGPYRGGPSPPGSGGMPPTGYGSLPRSSPTAAGFPQRADSRPTIPVIEPQYETPPIPAPYKTVSPRAYEQLAYPSPQQQSRGQYADHPNQNPQPPYSQTPPPAESPYTPYNLAAPAPLPALLTQGGRNPNGTRMIPISEDLAARSPPKEHPGQQRPWTLSLPGEGEEGYLRQHPQQTQPTSPHDDVVFSQPPNRTPSYSAANYPLPDSRITSPISERSVHSFSDRPLGAPPLPPPKIPHHQGQNQGGDPRRRSNTQHSEISAISGQPSPTFPVKHPQSSTGSPTKSHPSTTAVGLGLSSPGSGPHTPTSPTSKRALGRTPSSAAELETTEPDIHLARRRAHEEKLMGFPGHGARGVDEETEEEEEEEEVVMSSTAYPGQEWAPEGYGRWEGD